MEIDYPIEMLALPSHTIEIVSAEAGAIYAQNVRNESVCDL